VERRGAVAGDAGGGPSGGVRRSLVGENAMTRFRPPVWLGPELGGSAREGDPNWGVKKVRQRPWMAAGGERRRGATVSTRSHGESGERGFNRLGRVVTPRRSSCSSRATAGSGEAAARLAPEHGGDGGGGGGSGC
jgi:hypothetical protein